MKNIRGIIAAVVVTFLVTLVLNSLVDLLTQDKGAVTIGPAIQGNTRVPVDIANFTGQQFDHLILSVPVSSDIREIVSSGPVQVSQVPDTVGTADTKRVEISGIGPNQVTRLQVTVMDRNEAELVSIVNATQMRLGIVSVKDVHYPFKSVFERASVMSSINAVLYAVLLLWLYGQTKHLEERREKIGAELTDLKGELNKIRAEHEATLEKSRNDAQRLKLLLVARMSDYSKELDFWRDTVRRILYQVTGKGQVETVITQVTETLKTYSTRNRVDFDAVKVLAGLLSDSH